jgi:hypothetical protein
MDFFKNEVKKIRLSCGIPENGIKTTAKNNY